MSIKCRLYDSVFVWLYGADIADTYKDDCFFFCYCAKIYCKNVGAYVVLKVFNAIW